MAKKLSIPKERVRWGRGRVAVRARLAIIKPLLEEGWEMKNIYARLEDSLGGLSYGGFVYEVRKHLGLPPGRIAKNVFYTQRPQRPNWHS